MDDRRRTISSEEQMIGEALMRVSNTLEAQRLTKSLDYQEKLRTRSNIRLIIAIICLFVAMSTMVISGLLLVILWRYAEPVLDTVVPFLKGMFADFGIIWDGLVESLTYVPVMVEQLTRLLENVIIMLEGINSIDLAGMMRPLTAMLGAMSGMVVDLAAAMKSMMPMLSQMGQGLADMLSGDFSMIGDMLSGMGIDGKALLANMGSLINGMVNAMGGLGEVMNDAGNIMQSDEMRDLGTNLTSAIGGAAANINASDASDFTKGGGEMLSGMGSAMGALGNTMGSMVGSDGKIDLLGLLKGMLG